MKKTMTVEAAMQVVEEALIEARARFPKLKLGITREGLAEAIAYDDKNAALDAVVTILRYVQFTADQDPVVRINEILAEAMEPYNDIVEVVVDNLHVDEFLEVLGRYMQSPRKKLTPASKKKLAKKKKAPERKVIISEGLSKKSMKKYVMPHAKHKIALEIETIDGETYATFECKDCGVELAALDTEAVDGELMMGSPTRFTRARNK